MSYKIKLGTFSKLENSTAQPTTTTWAEYSVTLKEGCDISNPEITLSISYSTAAGYNYAYMMNRYYWIVGKNMLRENLCVLSLKVDVLATYKSEIGAASLYVLRSATFSNGFVRDTYFPALANTNKYQSVQPSIIVGGQETSIPGDYTSGIIVLNVAGTGSAGASTLWELTTSDFAELVNALYRDINGYNLGDVIAKVVQAFGGNPQALINSAMWFPFPFDVDSVANLKIGSWSAQKEDPDNPGSYINITGGIITDPVLTLPTVQFTIQKHPLAASRGAFLNLTPYTQYTLTIPGCSVVNLDNTKLQGETSISIYRVMDAFSGQMLVKVVADTSKQILAYLAGQIGIPISLRGSNNANSLIAGAASTIGGTIGAFATGGASAIGAALAAGISTAVDVVGGTPASSSMGAGFAAIVDETIKLDTVCCDIANNDTTHFGWPYCAVATLSTCSGYTLVANGDVAIPGPLPEQQEVKRFLETGYYYE